MKQPDRLDGAGLVELEGLVRVLAPRVRCPHCGANVKAKYAAKHIARCREEHRRKEERGA